MVLGCRHGAKECASTRRVSAATTSKMESRRANEVMNQEQWTNRFNQLQSSQDAAQRKAMERQIQQEHVMTGITSGGSYPKLDQAPNDRSRLTYDGLVH